MKMQTKDLVLIGILIALSFVLSLVTFNGGSIALDSAPAFLATFLFKDFKGPIVGCIGHMMSASTSGFALTLPVHLAISIAMFVMLYLAVLVARKFNNILAAGVIFMINVFAMPLLMFISIPFSIEKYSAFVALLGVAVIANLLIASVLIKPVGKVLIRNGAN